ncbi:MAG: lipoprotein-releasing ABC transporter permease subunit [Gammaproteobacteria bacterium]|nr:lipoprotein-releasing ABC transporter permease subunit [Gammaproteobacteria bacterium]
MFKPLPLYIGLRYTRAKRRNHFISFISLISVLGIALGVTVLITVLSVMNGFDFEIHNKIFSLARQVTISNLGGSISNWRDLENNLRGKTGIVAVAPYISTQAMLSKDGYTRGVLLSGILPAEEAKVSLLSSYTHQGSMQALKPGKYGIVLGQDIANYLGAAVGDKIVVLTPQASITPFGVVPRYKRFTVVGIFHVGEGFGYDSMTAFIHLDDAQRLMQMGNAISGINVKVFDLYAAPELASKLSHELPSGYLVTSWADEYGSYFKAIRMEKTMIFILLLFIVAVATFNLVSSLVMTVTDKQSDIAILKTLGAGPNTIMQIFMVQGGIIGTFGILLGIIGGILLAINAPALVKILEGILHTHFISPGAYFIDYLPSKLEWKDVVHVAIISFFMSLIATIYPAWRASKTQPAEALRYE